MILDLLHRLYEASKNACFSAIHIVKTLYRITVDATYLVVSFSVRTWVEGSIQLLKIFFYYPAIFAYKCLLAVAHTMIEGTFQLLKILFWRPIVFIKTLLSRIITAFFLIIKTIVMAIFNGITFLFMAIYRITIEMPVTALSSATTFIARSIAHGLKATYSVLARAGNTLTTTFKNIGFGLLSLSKSIFRTITAPPIALLNFLLFGLKTTINAAASLFSAAHSVVTSASFKIINISYALFTYLRALPVRLAQNTLDALKAALIFMYALKEKTVTSLLLTARKTYNTTYAIATYLIMLPLHASKKIYEKTEHVARCISALIQSTLISIAQLVTNGALSIATTLFSIISEIKSLYTSSIINTVTLISNALGLLKEKGSHLAGSAKNKSSVFIEKSRSRLDLMQSATRTALAGTAGFVFFSVPQTTIATIKKSLALIKRNLDAFVAQLSTWIKQVIQLGTITLPQIISLYVHYSHIFLTRIAEYLITKGAASAYFIFESVKHLYSAIFSFTKTIATAAHSNLILTLKHANAHLLALTTYGKRKITVLTNFFDSGFSLSSILIKSVTRKASTHAVNVPLSIASKVQVTGTTTLTIIQRSIAQLKTYTQTLRRLFKARSEWLMKRIIFQSKTLAKGTQKLGVIIYRGVIFTNTQLVIFCKQAAYSLKKLTASSLATTQKLLQNIMLGSVKIGNSTLSYSMKAMTASATVGKSGFLFLGKSSVYAVHGMRWSLKHIMLRLLQALTGFKSGAVFFGQALWPLLKQLAQIPARLGTLSFACLKRTLAAAENNRKGIQQYALLGSLLYVVLVLVTTYITPPSDRGIMGQLEIGTHQGTTQALPVNTSFELQNISYAKGTFGTVSIKGILSYSYEAGLESARNVDNITIEKAEKFTIKKLGSHMNHKHIVTTRFLVTATLGISASTSAAFPFAPTESMFVIKNNALSTNEMFYLPVSTSFSTEFNGPSQTKIHFKQPASSTQVTKSPKASIVLEHSGVPAYTLFTLYTLIMCLTFMALMSLGGLLPQTIRLAVSAFATTGLGIMWILSHLLGLLPTINHLFLTLLMCLAISLLCLGFNAKYVTENETRPEAAKTRWMLGLLTLLAVFFTLLIGL